MLLEHQESAPEQQFVREEERENRKSCSSENWHVTFILILMLNLLIHTVIRTVASQQVSSSKFYLPRRELPGPTAGSRSERVARWQAPGSRTYAYGFQSDPTRESNMGPPSRGLTTFIIQEGPKRLGAFSVGWQPKAGILVARSPTAEASLMDVECHFSVGEGS